MRKSKSMNTTAATHLGTRTTWATKDVQEHTTASPASALILRAEQEEREVR